MPNDASSAIARSASTIGVASGYMTKANVLRAGSRVMSITRPNRSLARSSAAAVSTDAETLMSICRVHSIGISSRRRACPVGAMSKTVAS